MALLKPLPLNTLAYEYESTRALLIEVRNDLLYRDSRSSSLSRDIDALLGIADHERWADGELQTIVRSVTHTYKGEGLTACGLEVVGPCPDCANGEGA